MYSITSKIDFYSFVLEECNKGNVVLLYFGAVWCGPCKQLKERLVSNETRKDMPNLSVGYLDVDIDEVEHFSNKYNINALPTQLFVKLVDDKVVVVSRVEGYDYLKLKLEYNEYVAIKN